MARGMLSTFRAVYARAPGKAPFATPPHACTNSPSRGSGSNGAENAFQIDCVPQGSKSWKRCRSRSLSRPYRHRESVPRQRFDRVYPNGAMTAWGGQRTVMGMELEQATTYGIDRSCRHHGFDASAGKPVDGRRPCRRARACAFRWMPGRRYVWACASTGDTAGRRTRSCS